MPLGLHRECRLRLQEALEAALPSLVINNGMFPERLSVAQLMIADMSLPRTGKLRDLLVEILEEFPLTEFVLETLGKELWELDRYQTDAKPKLTEIEGYEDAQALANRLLDSFESLPWTYRITVPLPDALAELLRPDEVSLDVSPSIRIVRATQEFAAQFPLETPNERLNRRLVGGNGILSILSNDAPKWIEGALYLQIAAEGFIGQYGSPTSNSAERQVRSLFGMGLATRLLESQHAFYPTPPRSFAYVHRLQANASWQPTTRYNFDDALTRGIASLKVSDLDGRLNADQKPGWISLQLSNISAAFRSGKKAESTILAAQWLFDSHTGHDLLLSFVQSMVVLEIVLGDKTISDEIGIGELISNRFAYLVGTTHDERTRLIDEFKQIYRVRSQIVHSGKHKLTLAERTLFSHLRWMGRRAIDKEIELLRADLAAPRQIHGGPIGSVRSTS